MYLWQIRHNPFGRQSRVNLTSAALAVAVIFALEFALTSKVEGQAETGQTPEAKREKPAESKNEPTQPELASNVKTLGIERGALANDFFAKVQSELRKHESIRCNIEQAVSIGEQKFKAEGKYLSSGSKLRIEYVVKPDQGLDGSLLEVCDGKQLWSLMTFANMKRVTHRDVQLIKEAAAAQRSVPETAIATELGLGGLIALFASLEKTMSFDLVKYEEVDGRGRSILQGAWKSDVTTRWRRKPDDPLPAYIPDQIRLYLNSKTLFPERIVYLKKYVTSDKNSKDKKESLRPLVSLSFNSVEFNGKVDDQEFAFTAPEDVVPEDLTRQYLDRLTKSAETPAAGATEAPGTGRSPIKGTGGAKPALGNQ